MYPFQSCASHSVLAWLRVVLAGVPMALVACGDGASGSSADPAPASVRQALSVDRGDGANADRGEARSCSYDHVYVTVAQRRVREGYAGSGDEESGWSEIAVGPPHWIDLKNLPDGLLQELGAPRLSAGHYTDLRLVLASSSTVGSGSLINAVQPTGGNIAPLSAPDGGARLRIDFQVFGSDTADLVLEHFDACASVVQADSPGRYVLKPAMTVQVRAETSPGNGG